MAGEDPTRRAVPSASVGVSHPPFPLSLVDECVRVLKERGGLERPLLPTVTLPGWGGPDLPPALKTKLLGNLPADTLRRVECHNPHVDTQRIWKGLCRRDFPDDFADAKRSDWREYYDLLRAGHHHKESRIMGHLRQGLAWKRQLAEARRAQPVPVGSGVLHTSAPPMPLLQRREGPQPGFPAAPSPGAGAAAPRRAGARPGAPTRPAVLARVLASHTLSRKEGLRLAADTAQAQLQNRHAAAAAAKRPRLT